MVQHRGGNSNRRVLVLTVFIVLLIDLTLAQDAHQQRLRLQFGNAKDPTQAYAMLETLAKAIIAEDENLGRKRISISNRVLAYDFTPASDATSASRPDRLTSPIEILIRTEVLERDFSACMPTEKFWVGPLDRVRSPVPK
jgi:cytochrome c-type biogenesis protein CcmH/NrfG